MINSLKPEILNFVTNTLKLKLNHDHFNPVEINIINEDFNPDGIISVIVDNWVLKIKPEALALFTAAMETGGDERLSTLANIVTSMKDKSISVYPYFEITVPSEPLYSDADDLIGDNFTKIDERFDRLFNLINTSFMHIAKNLTVGAECYNKDKNKIKDNDTYIHFNTKDLGEKTEFFITCGLVPAINKSSLSLTESANVRINDSLRPMTEDKKEELFNYPSANKEKAQVGITVKDEIETSLNAVNEGIKGYLFNKDAQKHPECLQYAVSKINTVLIPLIATLQLEPYGFFGGTGENVFDADVPSLNTNACAELIDEAVTALFAHLDNIPKSDGIAQYSIDVDNFGIYGRDEKLVVINQVVDPRYTFSDVFEPYYSLGFLEVFKRYLKTVKNNYVFSQIGKIDKESITSTRNTQSLNNTD